jgi:hypothetical protein
MTSDRPQYDPYANDSMGGYDSNSYSDPFQGVQMYRARGYKDTELPSELRDFVKQNTTPQWQRNVEKLSGQAGDYALRQGKKAAREAPGFIIRTIASHLIGDAYSHLRHPHGGANPPDI